MKGGLWHKPPRRLKRVLRARAEGHLHGNPFATMLQPRDIARVSQIGRPRQPLGASMSKHDTRPMSLWSIVEALQRRLERQGLAREVIDRAVVAELARAVSDPLRA